MTVLAVLHVLAAVLFIGPLVMSPFLARRSIAKRDIGGVRIATRQLLLFGLGSLLTAALGAGLLSRSTRYDFGTPWVIVSMTLFVVMLALVYGFAFPALRSAGKMVAGGVVARPDVPAREDPAHTSLTASAADLQAKERLDAIVGRVTLAGILLLLLAAAIVVLMVWRP